MATWLETQTLSDDVSVGEQSGLSASNDSIQLVSFQLADDTYGIEITRIREIILVGAITAVPQAAACVQGLINLRGSVIPVIDLRSRFGLPRAEQTAETRIMVINVRNRTIGITVDAVSEVLRVSGEQISPAPPTVANLGNDYLTDLVRLDDILLMLLDVDRLFNAEDEAVMDSAVEGN